MTTKLIASVSQLKGSEHLTIYLLVERINSVPWSNILLRANYWELKSSQQLASS